MKKTQPIAENPEYQPVHDLVTLNRHCVRAIYTKAKTGKLQFLCQDHYDMIVSYPGIESEKHLYTAFHKHKKTVAKYNDNIRVSHAFYEIGIFMGSPMFNDMGDDAKFVRESAIFNNGMNDWRVEDE